MYLYKQYIMYSTQSERDLRKRIRQILKSQINDMYAINIKEGGSKHFIGIPPCDLLHYNTPNLVSAQYGGIEGKKKRTMFLGKYGLEKKPKKKKRKRVKKKTYKKPRRFKKTRKGKGGIIKTQRIREQLEGLKEDLKKQEIQDFIKKQMGTKGAQNKKGGRRKKKKGMGKNPWIKHLQAYRKKYPNKSYKQCMIDAKKSYKKGGVYVGGKKKKRRRRKAKRPTKNLMNFIGSFGN